MDDQSRFKPTTNIQRAFSARAYTVLRLQKFDLQVSDTFSRAYRVRRNTTQVGADVLNIENMGGNTRQSKGKSH